MNYLSSDLSSKYLHNSHTVFYFEGSKCFFPPNCPSEVTFRSIFVLTGSPGGPRGPGSPCNQTRTENQKYQNATGEKNVHIQKLRVQSADRV